MRSSHEFNLRRERSIWRNIHSIDKSRLLFWSWYEPRNFGDWIGPYLFEAITGLTPLFCPREKIARFGCIMTVGSVLRHLIGDDCVVVWGSGIISGGDMFKRPREVRAVRGPLTRRRMVDLGYECPEIYGDPAILMPLFFSPERKARRHAIGVIPHFVDRHLFSERSDCLIIDPTRSVDRVVEDIVSCELTISSSLHGLIVSHAYGIPSVWVRPVNRIDGDDSKFRDYFLSVGLDPSPLTYRAYEEGRGAALGRSATLPSHRPLIEPLLHSCPFAACGDQ